VSTGTSTYRQRQSEETRARITRAARRVFNAKGYGAATIADVAKAAGVAVPTVYKLYGNKRSLLASISEAWTRHFAPRRDEDIPTDPHDAIRWWAATARRQWETGLDIGMIYAGAVASEPEVRKELEPRLAAREQTIRTMIERVKPILRPERSPDVAAAIASALTLPEVYRDLVRDRGWTPQHYEDWIIATLTAQLTEAASRGGGHTS
jgi:AcrR family transcriptional regulator